VTTCLTRCLLAAGAALRVLPVDHGVLGSGVHHQQRKTMAGQVEGHLSDRTVTAVEQQRLASLAAQRCGLVHAPGRSPDDGVLGIDADRGERCAAAVVAQ